MFTWCSRAVNRIFLSFLGCFAHTVQPAWPAFPALRPARVRLFRVLLGQRPSLHDLRGPPPPLFGRFAGTMPLYDSPPPCMWDLSLIAFSHRPAASRPRMATGSPGSRAWSFYACLGSSTPQGLRRTRDLTRAAVLPSGWPDTVGALILAISELIIPSLHMPLSNASSAALRPPSHGSGPGWIRYSFPV